MLIDSSSFSFKNKYLATLYTCRSCRAHSRTFNETQTVLHRINPSKIHYFCVHMSAQLGKVDINFLHLT